MYRRSPSLRKKSSPDFSLSEGDVCTQATLPAAGAWDEAREKEKRDKSAAAGSKQSAHFIFSVFFIYFSYHSSCRKDQSTVLILKLINGSDKKERTKGNEHIGISIMD